MGSSIAFKYLTMEVKRSSLLINYRSKRAPGLFLMQVALTDSTSSSYVSRWLVYSYVCSVLSVQLYLQVAKSTAMYIVCLVYSYVYSVLSVQLSIVCLVYSYVYSVPSVQLWLQCAQCSTISIGCQVYIQQIDSRLLKHCLSPGSNVIKQYRGKLPG